jgi:hypothetical protein
MNGATDSPGGPVKSARLQAIRMTSPVVAKGQYCP